MNDKHILLLRKGVQAWNQWRDENPNIKPDLSHANLSKINLKSANLRSTDLGGVNFTKAFLQEADFSDSDMSKCDFTDSHLILANFCGSVLWGTNFHRANVSDVLWDKKTKFKGVNVATCYSNEMFKYSAQNRSFFEEYKIKRPKRYYLWKIACDCGDSLWLWGLWSILMTLFFAGLYWHMGGEHFDTGKYLDTSFFTMAYYSVVTFTTLGFGDIIPKTPIASLVLTIEVIFGYIMLGGLIAIFSTKFIKRS